MSILRVMTFNIHGNDPEWEKERAKLALGILQRYKPDLIGLQEVVESNLNYFGEHLPGYGFEPGLQYGSGKTAAWCSMAWNKDRFDLQEAGKFWFSRTPEVESSDWGIDLPLGAAWAWLGERSSGDPFFLLNTHMEYCPEARLSHEASSRLILEQIEQIAPGLPVILTGDFNCNPWSAAYTTFLAGGFTDTYRAAGQADSVDSSTFHGFKGAGFFNLDGGDEMYWRVDWILARDGRCKLQTSACTIVREATPPFASDHYPVVSEIALL